MSAKAKPAAGIRIEESDDGYVVDTGAARFDISKKIFDLFREVRLADGTIIVPRPSGAEPRFGAVLRGLKPMVTRAHSRSGEQGPLALDPCRLFAGGRMEDYTLRFTSPREFEVTGAKSGLVGSGRYLKDFTSKDGLVSIPAGAWLNYAFPEQGDVYRFRTIPAWRLRRSARTSGKRRVLERGPLRSVIRAQRIVRAGPRAGPGVHRLVSLLRGQRPGEVGVHARKQPSRRAHA